MADRTELVGLPEGGPTTLAGVKLHLAITDDRDDDRITAYVAAVNAMVRTWRCSTAAVDQVAWPADIVEGATLLAARYFRRKNSPAGVEAMGSTGAVYVMRTDPDVAQLLQLGPHSYPTVG
jgi:hypothetical protein